MGSLMGQPPRVAKEKPTNFWTWLWYYNGPSKKLYFASAAFIGVVSFSIILLGCAVFIAVFLLVVHHPIIAVGAVVVAVLLMLNWSARKFKDET